METLSTFPQDFAKVSVMAKRDIESKTTASEHLATFKEIGSKSNAKKTTKT